MRTTLGRDFAKNPRDPKARFILVGFRLCQFAMQGSRLQALASLPLVACYRLLTEFVLGIELRPKTSVGPGLTIFHGFGLVVNDHAQLGADVTLRNGVTIGHKKAGGPCPVLHDGVVVGAGAIILGGVTIGQNASIGAGSVVLTDVPAGAVFAGNPARELVRGTPLSKIGNSKSDDFNG